MAQEILMNDVVPRIRAGAHSVPKIGHEDDEEIVQDSTLMAARMIDSAERNGRKFTPGNIAYYTHRAARSGRRSGYSGRSDALSPGCQLDGKAKHDSLDYEITSETGESGCLHDVIGPYDEAGNETDPAEEAARNLDWEAFLASHSGRHRTAINVLAAGGTMREAGQRCGLKDSAARNLKLRIAEDLIEFFGSDVIRRILDGVCPGWVSDLRTARERHLGHTSQGMMAERHA
ncbi:MAG: hypothetical protein H7A51_01450 [Akkermansiaceae bacterium]|nr:hypothetical protein [Akkermansiaceae bacterium]